MSLLKLSSENLIHLSSIYRSANWPLHVVSVGAIEHFIRRFKKQPEWHEKVNFFSLNESWKKTGTFVMVNTNDQHVLFDTLEPTPFKTLRKTFEVLNFDDEKVFVSFRDIFRPLVYDVIRVHNLEVTFDNGTRLIYSPRLDYDGIVIE
jgi:hypothetical protein